MEKHFLVTISDDTRNLFGVRFICSFFQDLSSGYQVTLLHVTSSGTDDMSRTLGRMWDKPGQGGLHPLSEKAKRAINESKSLLVLKDLLVERVETKTCIEQYGKTEDILVEGELGQYDAIILGRRASYSLQWMFENAADATAQAITRNICTIPVWICPEVDPERNNVLLCLDGSENSFRAADHAGSILANEEQHSVTLFHVESTTGQTSADIFRRARSILQRHRIPNERIREKTGQGRNISRRIQTEVDMGRYAAMAIGLHGKQEHVNRHRKLSGGTSARLISKVEKAALWCCP